MNGERLKKLRKEQKLTQEALGAQINVTKVSISGYENGNRTPDTDTLQRLADFFNVSTDYLLGRTVDSQPSNSSVFINNPILRQWYNELPNASEKDLEKLRKLWRIMKEQTH